MMAATTVLPESPAAPRAPARREERWLDVLMKISRAIGTIRDEQALMSAVMEQVTLAFSADRSSLYLHDPQRRELWTCVAQGSARHFREVRIADDEGLAGRTFQLHESLCVADTLTEPSFARRLAQRTDYFPRSMLLAPVFNTQRRCVGLLQVMDRRIARFHPHDLQLLEVVAVQVGITLENTRLLSAQKRQFNSFVAALAAALDARDELTALHSVNVANYAMGIAEVIGLPAADVEWLRIAGLLHDIGKIGVSEAVLTKAGRLSPDEFEEMKRHAEYSRRILSKIEFTEEFRELDYIAAAHHEKLDGSGYPDGLRGEQIPLKARILAVADFFDALTQTRHYRRSMTMHEAVRVLDGSTPHQLDATCVAALKAFLGCGPWPV